MQTSILMLCFTALNMDCQMPDLSGVTFYMMRISISVSTALLNSVKYSAIFISLLTELSLLEAQH